MTTGDPLTWRHLVAANAVPAAFVVGDAGTIADHFETWRDEGAADGFNVLSAFQPAQFEAFTRQAAPELRRRGLLRDAAEDANESEGRDPPRPSAHFLVCRRVTTRVVARHPVSAALAARPLRFLP